jgi:hypothetical protein
MQAFFQTEPQMLKTRPEQHHANLALLIFQREVDMPGTGHSDICDFSLDPDVAESVFQRLSNQAGEVRYSPDTLSGHAV